MSRSYRVPVVAVALTGALACVRVVPVPVSAPAPALPSSGWLDVTAPLDPATTPVYEGDAPLSFEFQRDMRRGDALTLSALAMGAHSGTHVDAPMHFIRDGAPVDAIALDRFLGRARVIEIADAVQVINAAELARHDWRGAERVLFRTRSSERRWMRSREFRRDFAYLTEDAARLLADGGVRLVGVDYLSAEQFGAAEPLAHRVLLGRGIPLVEGLLLEDARAGEYDLVVLPLRLAGHEGAPARAILRRLSPPPGS